MTDLLTHTDHLDRADTGLALSPEAQNLLFREGRTANAFSDEPVTDEQMAAVYELVKWGPTAMNAQPLRIVLVRTEDARHDLVASMNEGNRAKTAAAPLVAVLAADVDFHDEFHRTFPVFPGARDAYAADEQARTGTATFNAALQIGYFLVGIRAAGLAAGPMAGFDHDAVSRRFFPDGRHQALLVVNLGYPSEDSYRDRQPRLGYDDVVAVA
ncbi:malonic semialdehyde reductase [Microlunatus aurantiacus]|uniref:Malonic semialdehyde reductase n=1 Tax=Microlunatus aurantiacus TaxID=446786 RepID=A0ABP7DWM4_9ACTN